MSIASVVTRGFGNGTFNGTIPLSVTMGYDISAFVQAVSDGLGISASMSNNGLGNNGLINNSGLGKNGSIVFGFGSNSVMSNNGIGDTGLINNNGIGENGEL